MQSRSPREPHRLSSAKPWYSTENTPKPRSPSRLSSVPAITPSWTVPRCATSSIWQATDARRRSSSSTIPLTLLSVVYGAVAFSAAVGWLPTYSTGVVTISQAVVRIHKSAQPVVGAVALSTRISLTRCLLMMATAIVVRLHSSPLTSSSTMQHFAHGLTTQKQAENSQLAPRRSLTRIAVSPRVPVLSLAVMSWR